MDKDEGLNDYDEKRRDFLVQALTAGAFWIGAPSLVQAAWWGKPPYKLQKNKSIFSMNGDVRVNGATATKSTIIHANDKIETGDKSSVIFAVGGDSFILRGNSDLQLSGYEFFLNRLRMVSGGLLSVFGNRGNRQPLRMETPTATIGIRGTGVYMESEPDLSYLCTCYGTTQIASAVDANDTTQVTAKHHDEPKYITKDAKKGSRIRKAPFKNHTDPELKMLEALVGREVPFGVEGGLYRGPRRDY